MKTAEDLRNAIYGVISENITSPADTDEWQKALEKRTILIDKFIESYAKEHTIELIKYCQKQVDKKLKKDLRWKPVSIKIVWDDPEMVYTQWKETL